MQAGEKQFMSVNQNMCWRWSEFIDLLTSLFCLKTTNIRVNINSIERVIVVLIHSSGDRFSVKSVYNLLSLL